MADKTDNEQKELTPEELDRMAKAADFIDRKLPYDINVDGKTYHVRQISKAVRRRIHRLELESYFLSGKQKDAQSLKQANKIQSKLDTLHAKTAAYYLLNNKAIFNPVLFRLTWRRIMLRAEKHSAMINTAAINQEEVNFSLANWQLTEQQLALSMKPIGNGVKEMLKRMESASRQVDEDATKKKEAESKSTASPRKRPKMNA